MPVNLGKQDVHFITYLNGELHYETTRRRVLYRYSDGTVKMNHPTGDGNTHKTIEQLDGIYTVVKHIRTVQMTRFSDVAQSMQRALG